MTTLEYSKVFIYLANNNSHNGREISCFWCSRLARPTIEWKGRDTGDEPWKLGIIFFGMVTKQKSGARILFFPRSIQAHNEIEFDRVANECAFAFSQ